MTMTDRKQQRLGVVYGLGAFGAWGLLPLYFKAVVTVPPMEVLAHRIVWSLVLLGIVTALRGGTRELAVLFRDARVRLTLVATTCLIALNWGLFIWAIANERLLEASLGYFINPLVSVALGFVFLRERLRPLQIAAVGLATVSIVWLTVTYGRLPLISIVLALSFGLYGLLRKRTRATGVQGLTIETMLLTPVAAAWLIWRESQGLLHFTHVGPRIDGLLLLAGVVTALPLIWFAESARRLRLVSIAFMQYLAPTGQFLLATLAFGEPFTSMHAVSFGLIWLALILYTIDTVRALRRR
jgi:chloramphenicol-sensitive protein RarD